MLALPFEPPSCVCGHTRHDHWDGRKNCKRCDCVAFREPFGELD